MSGAITVGELLTTGDGVQSYATSDPALVVMEWEQEETGRLARLMDRTLRSHALTTACTGPFGLKGLLVKRLEPVTLAVFASADSEGAAVRYENPTGTELSDEAAAAIPGMDTGRLAYMEDVGLQAARSLRAHLSPVGVTQLELRLRFGIVPAGNCLLQVVNPVECRLGEIDYATLCAYLGGDSR